jgi:hypothetical protein
MLESIEPREAEVLMQKYLSGQLTIEEATRLLRHLKAQPALGSTLLSQMEIDALLREFMGAEVRNDLRTSFANSVLDPALSQTDLPGPTGMTASGRHSWSTTLSCVTGLAAALALVAGYWLWPDPDHLPRLASSSVGVEVRRGQERLPATRKLHLQAGDIIETGPGQSVVVEFAREGTRLEINPEAELNLLNWEKGKRFMLHRGQLKAVVARQPVGEPMVVTTPEAQASVRGTEFSLSSQWDATWLKVLKGAVELRGKPPDSSDSVMAGQFAVAARSVELRARPTSQAGLKVPVPVDPHVVSTGGDGDWMVTENTVRQSRVSRLPDSKPVGPAHQGPYSWFSRRIPVKGNIEVSLQVRLDAAVEELGPLGFTEFGFTLILDRRHLSFLCGRRPSGKGDAKLYSFVLDAPTKVEDGEFDERIRTPLASRIGQTFQLKARLRRLTSNQVQFQGKVWPQGDNEPADWQLEAIRNAPPTQPLISLGTRRCACTFSEVQVVLIE